jgi:hypothetical protein
MLPSRDGTERCNVKDAQLLMTMPSLRYCMDINLHNAVHDLKRLWPDDETAIERLLTDEWNAAVLEESEFNIKITARTMIERL